jgi:Skp family chaperone for outer membrane proteins
MTKKLLILTITLFTVFANAQSIAYVHQDSILAAMPNYSKNAARLDSITKSYQQDIKAAKDKLDQNLAGLLKSYNVKENEDLKTIKARMKAADTSSLSIMIDEDKIITKRAKSYEQIVSEKYKKDIQPSLDKINKAIQDYAVLNKLSMIYIWEQIRPALAYLDPKKNVTKAIIKALK